MKKTENGWIELIKIIVMAVIVFLPVVFLCLFIRNHTMDYSDGETPYYFWNRDFTHTKQDQYFSTLILGDSAANAAYLPEAMSEGTVNLSLGGTTIVENYYVLQDWLSCHEAPRTVYLSFMDYHLIYDNMFYERTVYSHRLTLEQEKEILKHAREAEDENIAVSDADLRLLEYNWYLPKYYLPALLNAGFTERRAENEEHYNDINLHRGAYIGLTAEMYADTDQNTYDSYLVNPLYDRYYRMFLQLCQEKGIQVRIVSLPKTGNSVLTPEYHDQRDGYYSSLVSDYDNAMYFCEVDACDGRYFLDWEHFNVYGGWMWSNYIRSRFPEDFDDEPMKWETLAGIFDYMKLAKDPDLLVDFASGKEIAVIAVTANDYQLLEKFWDTEKEISGKRVYIENGVEVNFMVNEIDGDINTVALIANEDGTHAIYLHGEYYPVKIDPYADLTLIFINTNDFTPALIRNYLRTGEGLVGN